MNIAHAFKSLKADWIVIVTSTGFSLAILVVSYIPLGKDHPWIPWLTFVIMWSFSWGWAFVRSWNRENRKVFVLCREFVLPELQRLKHEVSAGQIVFSSEDAELDFYFERVRAASRGIDREFLKQIIAIAKNHKPIVVGERLKPRISRL
jgi:hypothetical protein